MVYQFLALVSTFIINLISSWGYGGVFVLMALESALIPIPSEIIMPFAGFLVWEGTFSFMTVVLWGALGNLAGSIIAYFLGFYGGRPLLEKYGKYILISHKEIELADNWFKKYGNFSIFISRMLPVVRTFISLPAGIARMPFWKFSLYTFLGSLPWAFFLTYLGIISGENWKNLEIYFRKFDWLIIIIIIAAIGWWLYNKRKNYGRISN